MFARLGEGSISRATGAILELPLLLEIVGIAFGIFLARMAGLVEVSVFHAEPLHHTGLVDLLCGLLFAIIFHTLKEGRKSRRRITALTEGVDNLITTAIDRNLTKDVDASIIKLLSRNTNNDPLLGKLHVEVIHEYLAFLHTLNKNIQPAIAALAYSNIRDFLKKLSDEAQSGVSLTHKQQCEITEILTEGRKTYGLFELFIETGPDTWNKTFLQFVDSISVRRDISKEYTVVEDEKDLTEQQRRTLRICSEFYRKKGFTVYFCQKRQIMKALNEISFRENVIEVYGNVGCFTNLPDSDYSSPKKFDCRYLDIENSPLEKNLLSLMVKFREPMEDVRRRLKATKPKPPNLSVVSGDFSKK